MTYTANPQPFKAEVTEVLRLVVNSLYSHKEIFLRELVSNASDALDKIRFRALSEPELLGQGEQLKIQVSCDAKRKTLTISDNGIGMTGAELSENLGTIARSGTREFAKKLEEAARAKNDLNLIGQFGVGFYSAYLVADRVEVVSRAAGTEQAHRWISDAKESFIVEPAERATHGTSIILHLKDGELEFAQRFRIKGLIQRYSDYIGYPIELAGADDDDADEADAEASKDLQFETVNQASALWQRAAKDVSPEQYQEFYKHLTHDWEAPLAERHFHVEGTQMFVGLLFLPSRPQFDLFDADARHGVRLHVRRVFVMEDCAELVPRYLRFIRGVVDSEDLPLNVSREILQDSQQVRVIRKQVVSQALGMLEQLERDDAEKFKQFWTSFGAVLKEGLHFDADSRDRVAKLVRYESSTQAELTTLAGYVSRMKEGQEAIYYALGASRRMIEASPHLERLKQRGLEVLFMTDPVDPFAVEGLKEFDGKSLISAMADDLKLSEESVENSAEDEAKAKAATPLLEAVKLVLGDKVSEVRASKRLEGSPVCLVLPDGGLAPHIERLLRMRNANMPATKRILEVNLNHPVIEGLARLNAESAPTPEWSEWVWALYDQALIAEGSPIEDPSAFARRLSKLLEKALAPAAA